MAKLTQIWSNVLKCTTCHQEQANAGQSACLRCGAFWSLERVPTSHVPALAEAATKTIAQFDGVTEWPTVGIKVAIEGLSAALRDYEATKEAE